MKRKDSMALFEVIARNRDKKGKTETLVPGWIKGEHGEEHQAPPDEPAPATPRPQPRPPAAPTAAEKPKEPPRQIELSVSYTAAGVIALGVVVLLVAAFLLGRITAPDVPTGTGQTQQAGMTDGGQAGQSGNGQDDAGSTQKPERVSGKYYLVVQSLKSDPDSRAEAIRIARFATEHGFPAEARQFTSGDWFVWSLAPGFDAPRNEEAKQFARKIEQLGKKYFEEYRTYDFRQRRGTEFDPFFVPAP